MFDKFSGSFQIWFLLLFFSPFFYVKSQELFKGQVLLSTCFEKDILTFQVLYETFRIKTLCTIENRFSKKWPNFFQASTDVNITLTFEAHPEPQSSNIYWVAKDDLRTKEVK